MTRNDGFDGAAGDRLDEIPTQWSLLRLAHRDSFVTSGAARNALVLRYNRAIRAYIGAMVRDPNDADELSQEVVMRLARGDFARATPDRGRFRDLLKVAVRNMVKSHWSREGTRARKRESVPDWNNVAETDDAEREQEWLSTWRQAVLDLAWQGLERFQKEHRENISYTLLRLRADAPDASIGELLDQLTKATGAKLKEPALRQQLRRARLRFAELLLDELARSLDDPTPERIEEELVALELLDYIGDFLPEDWRATGMLKEES